MSKSLSAIDPERERLAENDRREKNWQRWGSYLPERQWGTVREDYSGNSDAWSYFPFDQAKSRAYRWGDDGLLGLCDREGRMCFAVALWNGKDAFLKERLFGLSGPQGNHGEDVKECYFYLDATPTHSWMRALYKYPQAAFPYDQLREENGRRTKDQPEFELVETGVFDENRYFDVEVRYAKAGPNDFCIEIEVTNCGPEEATIHVLPTLWYRNGWSWGCRHEGCEVKPRFWREGTSRVRGDHASLGKWSWETEDETAPLLFTENETNMALLFNGENASPYVKDGINAAVVEGRADAVNPAGKGTKVAAHHPLTLGAGASHTVRGRLYAETETPAQKFGDAFETVMRTRKQEADLFFENTRGVGNDVEKAKIARQAFAGLLWTKQFYHYIVKDWLEGDTEVAAPPEERKHGRNAEWAGHLYSRNVLSMPDKWEYPWFAAWDTAFHMIPMARIDPYFAKNQLNLFLREWYMHPNGQIPAYEWNFSDVNPPVHAWACWRVYKLTGRRGERDRTFLARTFQKLLLNFTWWVNRKDPAGNNLFAGGFLGLDNIGVFDRSQPLPAGGRLTQADGTAWMAFYCSTMLAMALELAEKDPVYEDIASKFFEHFVAISDAMNHLGGSGLWHEEDGFYYDQWVHPDGRTEPVRLRSLVGLVPLFAVEFIDEARLDTLPGFAKRTRWFLENRKDLARSIAYFSEDGRDTGRHLLAIPSRERLARVLRYVFDEQEFLSPHGVRSMSQHYREDPFVLQVGGQDFSVNYVPGDSNTGLFGGNSNWRGPIWFPMNFLIIEALERYHAFYGESFKVELPTGSGNWVTLDKAAAELSRRLSTLFTPDENGARACHGADQRFAQDPRWKDLLLFHEFFDGDTGLGLGANHQTGWTALIVSLLDRAEERRVMQKQRERK